MTGEGKSRFSNEAAAADRDQLCCVWEVQDRRTGMKFTVADGYADFLREPAAHTVKIEGFFNIFPLVLNPLEDEKDRSEEHTSELQSLMRISYAVFCLKKKKLSKPKAIE